MAGKKSRDLWIWLYFYDSHRTIHPRSILSEFQETFCQFFGLIGRSQCVNQVSSHILDLTIWRKNIWTFPDNLFLRTENSSRRFVISVAYIRFVLSASLTVFYNHTKTIRKICFFMFHSFAFCICRLFPCSCVSVCRFCVYIYFVAHNTGNLGILLLLTSSRNYFVALTCVAYAIRLNDLCFVRSSDEINCFIRLLGYNFMIKIRNLNLVFHCLIGLSDSYAIVIFIFYV